MIRSGECTLNADNVKVCVFTEGNDPGRDLITRWKLYCGNLISPSSVLAWLPAWAGSDWRAGGWQVLILIENKWQVQHSHLNPTKNNWQGGLSVVVSMSSNDVLTTQILQIIGIISLTWYAQNNNDDGGGRKRHFYNLLETGLNSLVECWSSTSNDHKIAVTF